ncbi:response regulator transcription factor [Protaetiibacter mangrovi]|uniref:Response regulator transcription factor n=1 Tax=Protaetiibacter mangrovi TaxID=2970926 RepID=A0ABT1ZFH4_9MICO|nr:response regulator transcription factor [Protaetiibacter mangrovi]MCS0499443.1 response regulator transcription factor [Protaetiibacter mangrovi]TPX05194.1 response regulator transcription factor [Schumannella luteola]
MPRILVAEDEARISSFIEKGLKSAGYGVETVADGVDALALARSGEFDLLLLDIGLPGIDGFEVLRRLREGANPLPVVILTARDSAADTVAGFEGGANDYIAKPFRFDELLARVRVRLQDARQQQAQPAAAQTLDCGRVSLDLRTRRITSEAGTFDLSAREYALAEEFMRNPEQVLSREQLLSRVWGLDFDPGSNVVDVYVRYLRRKIGADHLKTVRGMGYRFTGAPD